MLQLSYLDIDGLVLYGNGVTDFQFGLEGLFDLDRTLYANDLLFDGANYTAGRSNTRKFVLSGSIINDVLPNYFALTKILYKRGTKRVTVGYVGMPVLCIDVEVTNIATDTFNPGILTATLEAPDPALYGNVADTVSIGGTTGASSLILPAVFPVTMGATTQLSGVVTNAGNTNAYPVFTIIGTCSNIILRNNTTGVSMTINVSLGASDTLVVDCRLRSRGVYLNGVSRLDLYNSGYWINCVPGDNTIIFTRTTQETKYHCSVSLAGRWM